MRVVLVGGARPNFMKIKPVLDALERRGAECLLVHTGQHYDPELSAVFFDELGIRMPDRSLGVGSAPYAEQTGKIMMAFGGVLDEMTPDIVVVVGDVNSTVACALMGAQTGSLVAHVEAGLRSRDWTMPEEINRVVTDRVSDYLFAPSEDAVTNLRKEGYRNDQIHFVGNVMIDTLLSNVDRACQRMDLDEIGVQPGGYALVTLHRPDNVDEEDVLERLVGALARIAKRLPVVFPAHPRTLTTLGSLNVPDNVRVSSPIGYLDFIALEAQAAVVLTDSGGIQEETTVLGVPCLTLRENTERPLTVTEGTNTVVGHDPDRIVAEAERVLRDGVEPRRPALWDGKAAERIADVIVAGGGSEGRPRPTEIV